MNTFLKMSCVAVLGLGFHGMAANAQTDGSVELNAKVLDMTGNGTEHWTVAWVTKADGTFIKTIWKQGPSMTSSKWSDHCKVYNSTRTNTQLDGYSSGTAQDYSAAQKNPLKQTWDCRDASNNLMPDGDYKFWVQYAEDVSHSRDGPYTTLGLRWTKGAMPSTTTYDNQGSNFSNMNVVWSPVLPPTASFTSVEIQGSSIIITGTGTVSTAYTVVGTTNLNQAIELWPIIDSGTITGAGSFSNSVSVDPDLPHGYIKLVLP